AYMDWYTTNSTKVRSELSCQLNVPFGYTRAEHLDIFPAPQPEAPIMVSLLCKATLTHIGIVNPS
ncbi:MAG: hypothetical protein AAF349_26150, partial [Cyanobacteria bacterium P01_A01_bin.68]